MIVALPAHTIRHLSSLSLSGTDISRCWARLPVFLQFFWPRPPQERIFSKRVGRILFFSPCFFLHTRHRKLSLLLVFFPLRTDIFFVTEFFHLIRVIKLALTVVWVQDEINICRKKWKVYTISINLVYKKLQRRNWCNLITQRIGYRPLWAGRMGRILPALGTNQIAGFVEYRPLTTWEKN